MYSSDPDKRPYPEIHPAADGFVWTILHARPRAEKKIREHYHKEGITIFLPLRHKEHRYGNRVREFWSPLFPGYVFGRFPEKQVHTIRQNQHVANVLTVVHQDALVHQLQQLKRAVQSGELLDVMPYIEAGKTVRIISGPFKGVEGVVQQVADKTRVMVGIEMIQQSVAMWVDGAAVELV